MTINEFMRAHLSAPQHTLHDELNRQEYERMLERFASFPSGPAPCSDAAVQNNGK